MRYQGRPGSRVNPAGELVQAQLSERKKARRKAGLECTRSVRLGEQGAQGMQCEKGDQGAGQGAAD
jgi:hypothetical protein